MIAGKKLFDTQGELRKTELVGDIVDTLLAIYSIGKYIKVAEINLELRRCGFFISFQTQEDIIDYLTNRDMLSRTGRYQSLKNEL